MIAAGNRRHDIRVRRRADPEERRIEGNPSAFGEAADLVRSAALVRLEISASTPPALLAFGSRDSEKFHPGQATELIGFLAAALESIIRGWLTLPD